MAAATLTKPSGQGAPLLQPLDPPVGQRQKQWSDLQFDRLRYQPTLPGVLQVRGVPASIRPA